MSKRKNVSLSLRKMKCKIQLFQSLYDKIIFCQPLYTIVQLHRKGHLSYHVANSLSFGACFSYFSVLLFLECCISLFIVSSFAKQMSTDNNKKVWYIHTSGLLKQRILKGTLSSLQLKVFHILLNFWGMSLVGG